METLTAPIDLMNCGAPVTLLTFNALMDCAYQARGDVMEETIAATTATKRIARVT